MTNDTRQPNENKRRQTRSNATLIIRFCRLFRGGRTAHTGLVAPVPWFVADFENGSSRTEQAGTIQLANKYTFVSQLPDLTASLHQRDQGAAQIGVRRR